MTIDQQQSLQEDRTVVAFWLFAAAHLVLWTAVPTLTQPNAPLDTIQLSYWGHEWQWGYHKHPPLPAWIIEISCLVFGRSAWATYLGAQLLVVTCFWAAWQLARDFLRPWQALAAAMLLEASYYYNYTTPELNNNVVSRTFWALSILFFYRALSRKRWLWWVLTGANLAVGMSSRYDTAVLGAAMVGFLVVHPLARRSWRSAGPYLTIATGLAIFSPHIVWVVTNDFPTIRYFLDRSATEGVWLDHLVHPIKFVVSQLGAVAPIALLAIPLVASWKPREIADPTGRYQRDFLIGMVVGPVALIFCASLLAGFAIQSMWGTALWTFTGVLVLFLLRLRDDGGGVRRLATSCVAATLLAAAVLTVRNVGSPYLRAKGSRVHYPGRQLAAEVERRWQQRHDGPLQVVGGTWWAAGNVAFYASHRASVFADLDPAKGPWVDDQTLRKRGGVVLWHAGAEAEAMQAALAERFPKAKIEPPIKLAWQTGADLQPIEVGIALIDPAGDVPKLSRRPVGR